jgi:hypothetical protein
LIESAQQGLVSFRRDDHDFSGKVVIDPDAHGDIIAFLGEDQLKRYIDTPGSDVDWGQWLSGNEVVALDVFFYLAFHREPKVRPIQARLDRIAESGHQLCESILDILQKKIRGGSDIRTLADIGFGIEGKYDARTCLLEFVESLRRRSFEQFVRRYFARQ